MNVGQRQRTVEEWTAHWDAKSGIEDPVELNGYCVAGVPLAAELYRKAVLEPVLERLELEPRHHVLEVGCGSGLLLREIEQRVERAVGTDISEALISRYRGSAETHVCAAHELPFEREEFDRILMYGVVQYFPGLDYFSEVVHELVTLLRAPGILVIGDVLLGDQPEDTPYLWYDRRTLVGLLEPLGLPFSMQVQSRLKRTINLRYDVVIYKD